MPGVSLALSLHAPTQELRCRIVPTARSWPLHVLMAAIDDYMRASQSSVLMEYVLIGGVNDGAENAHALGNLLKDRDVKLNFIPYNPSAVPDNFRFVVLCVRVSARCQRLSRGALHRCTVGTMIC